MADRPSSTVDETTLVEFFGLPGAGKTTLANSLPVPEGTLRREDLTRALRSLPVGRLAAVVMRTLLDLPWLWALFVLALKTPIWRFESLRRLVRIAATKNWIASQEGLVVLDQGPLQGLWSIFFTEGVAHPPKAALARVLRHLYSDVALVIVEISVDPELAAERVSSRTRGNSRLDDLPVGTVRDKLEKVGPLPDELLDAARQAGLAVRSFSGRTDLPDLSGKVASVLN